MTTATAKFKNVYLDFSHALKRLEEVLDASSSDLIRDAAIKRFEFTIELAWKTLKALLEEKSGITCASPKECFREAYRQGFINYSEQYLKLLDLRNDTAHTYNEVTADIVYEALPEALIQLQRLKKYLLKASKTASSDAKLGSPPKSTGRRGVKRG